MVSDIYETFLKSPEQQAVIQYNQYLLSTAAFNWDNGGKVTNATVNHIFNFLKQVATQLFIFGYVWFKVEHPRWIVLDGSKITHVLSHDKKRTIGIYASCQYRSKDLAHDGWSVYYETEQNTLLETDDLCIDSRACRALAPAKKLEELITCFYSVEHHNSGVSIAVQDTSDAKYAKVMHDVLDNPLPGQISSMEDRWKRDASIIGARQAKRSRILSRLEHSTPTVTTRAYRPVEIEEGLEYNVLQPLPHVNDYPKIKMLAERSVYEAAGVNPIVLGHTVSSDRAPANITVTSAVLETQRNVDNGMIVHLNSVLQMICESYQKTHNLSANRIIARLRLSPAQITTITPLLKSSKVVELYSEWYSHLKPDDFDKELIEATQYGTIRTSETRDKPQMTEKQKEESSIKRNAPPV